jgi:hypothetical protein
MDPRAPEDFIGVDISQAANAPLVEQKRLDASAAPAKKREKFLPVYGKRIFTQAREKMSERFGAKQAHTPKSPDVVQAKLVAILERNPYVRVRRNRVGRTLEGKPPGHPEMNQQAVAGVRAGVKQIQEEIFAVAARRGNGSSRQRGEQPPGTFDEIGLSQAHADHPASAQQAMEASSNRFDFGQFGHPGKK